MSLPAWAVPDVPKFPCIHCGTPCYGGETTAQCDECREYFRAGFNATVTQ